MKLANNRFKELVYADIFDAPLKIGRKYYVLPGREKLIRIYQKREKISRIKKLEGQKIANYFRHIPFVEAVFLTGSVAAGNATAKADIDLMIITKPNSLWITRLLVFSYLKIENRLKKPICPNIFLDTNHLEVFEKNIYTAHEVKQAKMLFDRGGTAKQWLQKNKWVEQYCHAELVSASRSGIRRRSRNKFGMTLLLPFELIAYWLQYLYMKSKVTNESVGWGYAYFHPRNLSKTIDKKYSQRLVKYRR